MKKIIFVFAILLSSILNAQVTSVNTRFGVVTLTSADITPASVSGTNVVGTNEIFTTGQGTGNSAPAMFRFNGYKKGISGSSLQTAQTYGYLGVNTNVLAPVALYLTSATPTNNNFAIQSDGISTTINSPGSTGNISLRFANSSTPGLLLSAAGFNLQSTVTGYNGAIDYAGNAFSMQVTNLSTSSQSSIYIQDTTVQFTANNLVGGSSANFALYAMNDGTSTVVFNAENTIKLNSNLSVNGNGGLQLNESSPDGATMGYVTLSAGTATVNTSAITSNCRIFVSINGIGTLANVGTPYEDLPSRTLTSFTIKSTNALDNSAISWFIIQPQ